MTRDDIISMAREAGFQTDMFGLGIWDSSEFNKFANLVAAAEREACASLKIEVVVPAKDYSSMTPLDCYEAALIDTAIAFREAIRAIGQK